MLRSAHMLLSRSAGSELLASTASFCTPPACSTLSFMGLNSSTMLHSVADALACTLGSLSESSRSRGSTTGVSTSTSRRFLTDRLSDFAQRHAAARTPASSSSIILTMAGTLPAATSCRRLSSRTEHSAPSASRVLSRSRAVALAPSLRKCASLLMASASAAASCSSSLSLMRLASTRGASSPTPSPSPSSFTTVGSTSAPISSTRCAIMAPAPLTLARIMHA
mmetsp:Transcript_57068/g.180638  ORF Transcript_57068/g.180638 Transcript_57068/m.180638 type:complete len:223 (+) Transcript_57068:201-869(+)